MENFYILKNIKDNIIIENILRLQNELNEFGFLQA
jgi:hypothetical protein